MTKTYHVTRKYPAEQYGNFDIGVDGLMSYEEINEELKNFDLLSQTYKQRLEEEKNKQEELKEPFPDRKGPKLTGGPKATPF